MKLLSPLCYLALFVLVATHANAQLKFYEDSFVGGVTAAGYSPKWEGSGDGTFAVSVPANSTIRKAYLLVGRVGNAPAINVTLNGATIRLDATSSVSSGFVSPPYGGPSAVHAIDLTSSISPAVQSYRLEVPLQSPSADRYAHFYLYIAYEDPTLQKVNTAIYLNNKNFASALDYTLQTTNAFANGHDVGLSLFCGYVCRVADYTDVRVNGTYLGRLSTNDLNTGECGGPIGSFYYQNSSLFGLHDDDPDQTVGGADALSNIAGLVSGSLVNVALNSETDNNTNCIWAMILAYGAGPAVIAGPKNDTICIGDSVQLSTTVTAAQLPATYAWSPATGLNRTDIPNPVAKPQTSTGYEVTMTDANGDKAFDSVCIVVVPIPSVSIQPSGPVAICAGDSAVLSIVPNGNAVLWSTGSTSPSVWVSQAGTYSVVLTNPAGCADSGSTVVTFRTAPQPTIVTSGPLAFCKADVVLSLAENYSQVLWSTGEQVPSITVSTPGDYSVLVTDSNGCTGMDTITVNSGTAADWFVSNPPASNYRLSFGGLRITQQSCGYVTVDNRENTDIEINAFLHSNTDFSIPQHQLPFSIAANTSRNLQVCFHPVSVSNTLTDTLYLYDECTRDTIPLVGSSEADFYTAQSLCAMDMIATPSGLAKSIRSVAAVALSRSNPSGVVLRSLLTPTVNVTEVNIYSLTGSLVARLSNPNETMVGTALQQLPVGVYALYRNANTTIEVVRVLLYD